MFVGLAIALAAASLGTDAAAVDLYGSVTVDLEASETTPPTITSWMTTAGLAGEAWRTSARLTLIDGGSASFDLYDERTFGPFDLRSACTFDADTGFSRLGSAARFELLDLEMGNYVFLSREPPLSYDQLTARWTSEGVSFTSVLRVGLCPIEFRSAQAAAQAYVARCDLFLDVRGAFTADEGFDYLRVSGRFPRFALLSNGVIETELRLTAQFEEDRKRFVPSLRMRSGSIDACMTPYVEALEGEGFLAFDGVAVYGWTVECAVGDAVEASFVTSLDPARNRELTGEAEYWEVWTLRGSAAGCCDESFRWDLATYFGDAGGELFGWGRTTFSAEIPITNRLSCRVGAEYAAAAPRWTLSASWKLRF